VLAGLGLVLVVLVGWGVARRQLRRVGAGRDCRSGTTLVLSLPPVPAPRPRAAGPVREQACAEDRAPRGADAAGAVRPPSLENVVLMAPAVAPRPVRRCGHCRAVGHTRTTCPRLTGALPLPQL
jgi:hypothetical protein